jgi:quercetin dioxygenase-like cupin family protein
MYTKSNSSEFKHLLPGIQIRPLVFGKKTHLCEFLLLQGYNLPWHNHPYEQTGFLISGKLRFTIGERVFDSHPGDSWCIPENEFHGVEVLENAHVLELFSPVRPDYLPENLK